MDRLDPRLPQTWLGANFWSRTGGPLMWRNYSPDVVREELAGLHDHGLNMTRSFFYWPDLQPEPEVIDEEKADRFADFLDAHRELEMSTIPTFIVGHMSGENWDPAWRNGRSLYCDVWMVGQQAWYIENLTRRFADHPAIAGWLISNEIPIYAGEAEEQTVTTWARIMVQAVRAGGGTQPVSIGDGAWGADMSGHASGFSTRRLAGFTDYVGPHVYQMETDIVRSHLKAAFVCELAAIGGRPVVLEEFGLSSDFASPEHSRSYYRQVLTTTLLAGAVGWIAWNNTDFDDLAGQRPYSHHPFELHFGITDSHGRPKPPLEALAEFSRLLERIDFPHCHRAWVDAALVVSSYLAAGYLSVDETQRRLVVRHTEQAYIAAKEAGLAVGVVREQEDGGLPEGYRLYLVPSVKELTAPSWHQLVDLAEAGACVYASYCAGESPSQRGPWWSATEELFGVRNDLAYGINNPVVDDLVEMRLLADLGDLRAGTVLTFPTAGTENSRAFLPVTVTDGRVVAVDAAGRPMIVVKEHGRGLAVLSTLPLEHFAARRRDANPEDTWRLYRALGLIAGIESPVQVEDPRVLIDAMEHDDGRIFHILVSERPEATEARVHSREPLSTLDGEPVTGPVHLDPYGVAVLVSTPSPQENR
ncbi:MAG: cellulase family glycosylhydrolase [Acidipropionibacterium jensenii]|nr:cellulase family glycosylhydrolase [Acidipropionibacterium jensenii]